MIYAGINNENPLVVLKSVLTNAKVPDKTAPIVAVPGSPGYTGTSAGSAAAYNQPTAATGLGYGQSQPGGLAGGL